MVALQFHPRSIIQSSLIAVDFGNLKQEEAGENISWIEVRPRRFFKNYLNTLAIVAGSRNIMASLVGKQVLLSILVQHIFCRSVMHQNEFFFAG